MKKPTLLVPRNQVREVLSDPDAVRMLESGSWVQVSRTAQSSEGASWQRTYRQRRRDAGERMLLVWISESDFENLMALKRKGESNASLVTRLIRLLGLIL